MSGSDKKYRTDKQIMSDLEFNRRRENEYKQRADACARELLRREDLEHHGHSDDL